MPEDFQPWKPSGIIFFLFYYVNLFMLQFVCYNESVPIIFTCEEDAPMKYKALICLLALLLLTGCHQAATLPDLSEERPVADAPAEAETPPAEEPAPPADPLPAPDADALFLYTKDNRTVVVRGDGTVVLQSEDGTLDALTDTAAGTITGLIAQRQEGSVPDPWGTPSPQRQWCLLYGLDGQLQLELPLVSVRVCGDFLWGANSDTGLEEVYRRSTGQLLYDNVTLFSPLGSHYYLAQDVWGGPGVILTEDGQTVARTPQGYTINTVLGSRYLVTNSGNSYGLLDENGRELFPCQYSYISTVTGGYLLVQQEGGPYQVIDPADLSVVFRWDYLVQQVLPESLVAAADFDFNTWRLVDYDGNALIDQDFNWIDCAARDETGAPTLLYGVQYADSGSILSFFTPDGQMVTDALDTGGSYNQLISDRAVLTTASSWDSETQTGRFLVQTTDFHTGQVLFRLESTDGSACPLFPHFTYGIDPEPGFLILSQENEQGWSRYSILREDGTVVLADLEELDYLGQGVVQCTRGWTSGLMRLDGTWLYQESRFSTLNDE